MLNEGEGQNDPQKWLKKNGMHCLLGMQAVQYCVECKAKLVIIMMLMMIMGLHQKNNI